LDYKDICKQYLKSTVDPVANRVYSGRLKLHTLAGHTNSRSIPVSRFSLWFLPYPCDFLGPSSEVSFHFLVWRTAHGHAMFPLQRQSKVSNQVFEMKPK